MTLVILKVTEFISPHRNIVRWVCKVTTGNRSGKALHSRPQCQNKTMMSVLVISLHILGTNQQFSWNMVWTLCQWTMPQSHITLVSHGRCLNVWSELYLKKSILKLCILVTHTHFHYISIKAIITGATNIFEIQVMNLPTMYMWDIVTGWLWQEAWNSKVTSEKFPVVRICTSVVNSFQRENNSLHATKQIPECLCSSHLLRSWIL